MGFPHWKKAVARNETAADLNYGFTYTYIGLFKRCIPSPDSKAELCFPNLYPKTDGCGSYLDCVYQTNSNCSCDYLPSTKGIAACAIIASIFLGLAIIILFIHSINTSETRSIGLVLGLFPLILLILTFIFILITLILIGCYLSRDIMTLVRYYPDTSSDLSTLRSRARDAYKVRVDWSTGLEIISLVFTFLSLILYMDRLNIITGDSPIIHSTILLDKKYHDIRNEAINAGILLKETDEKVDEIIKDGFLIKSHAHNIQSNALRFYRNLIQSEKLIQFCQFIFIIIIISLTIIFIGKFFLSKIF
ncbi:unnamed protein product [Adineta steineri]|uniref:Uncharacterized protein n=1 Tax=Adineta steineri TaxID=433720 RepID=A0A818L470_9BILA|nr:unnamed protein product [Adineta steineri]